MSKNAFQTRRSVLIGAAAATLESLLPGSGRADELILTPGQTEGPFYPVDFPSDADDDLVRVAGKAAQALGQVSYVAGRILDRRGHPLRGATVEIWQCDANGRYRHPEAPEVELFDSAFQGYGRIRVDAEGQYAFRTIRPVSYPGRTPHIHFAVAVPGTGGFVTQLYVEGEPLNERDWILNHIRNPRQRASVVVPFVQGSRREAGALEAKFDIVLDL
jgi:protocatechuate 3,4-dioxygenase beta subunit